RDLIARLTGPQSGLLYNALHDPAYCDVMLESITGQQRLRGSADGELVAWHTRAFDECRGPAAEPLPASLGSLEQTNAVIRFGQRLILQAYRRVAEGLHPELEAARCLTEDRHLPCVARLPGAVAYPRPR